MSPPPPCPPRGSCAPQATARRNDAARARDHQQPRIRRARQMTPNCFLRRTSSVRSSLSLIHISEPTRRS
eukprot:6251094-Prymnesium_polylepis.1